MWTDRQMDKQNGQMNGQNYTNFETNKKRTNERTKLHQFRMEPRYDDDLSPCQV